MGEFLRAGVDVEEVPIDAITNGIHSPCWVAPEMDDLFKRYLGGDWADRVDDAGMWEPVMDIPDEDLWRTPMQRKQALIDYTRRHLSQHHLRLGEGSVAMAEFEHMLNADALIIGFARRFATYKRATLIFHNLDRISRILTDPERPVHILFAGKTHPATEPS